MNRFNQLLIAALVVQIIIAGGIYISNQAPAAEQMHMALLSTDSNTIDRITIDEGDDKHTVLSKVDGIWQLPDYHQLPASRSKVDEILAKLESTHSGWPVATTASSRERFQVADKNYQKKISVGKGDDALQTLYLGTSPGFRQLHVRRAGEDEVYVVKLNSYEFPSQHTSWLDTALLQPGGDITSLQGSDFVLNKQGDGWQLAEGDGEAVKQEIDKLINSLARVSVQGVAEKTLDNTDYVLTVKAAGNTLQYRLFKDGNDHYISRNDYVQTFKINQSDYEKITGQNVTQLVKRIDVEDQSAIAESEYTNSEAKLTTPSTEQE
jgi:hypothetical protein